MTDDDRFGCFGALPALLVIVAVVIALAVVLTVGT
jgi:hypothetical protein